MIKLLHKADKAKPSAESIVKGLQHAEGSNFFQKLLRHRTFLFVLAVLVVAIAVVTWPSSFGKVIGKDSSHAALDKFDACKNETDMAAKNNCYRDLAFSNNQSYFCTKVFNSSKVSESCFAELAIEANSKRSCENIKDVKARSYCTSALAINKIELPLCDNVDDKGWQNYCYAKLAILAKRPDTCLKIDSEDEVADCYLSMAKNLSSGPTCAYIPDQIKRDDCFLSIGVVNSDPALCAEIGEPPKRWTCYHRVAKKTGNIALCSHVPAPLNANCIQAVKEAFPDKFA